MNETTKLALKARGYFPLAPRRQAAKQALSWAKSVVALGDKRLTNTKVVRLEQPRYI
jgi:hypothetical protein